MSQQPTRQQRRAAARAAAKAAASAPAAAPQKQVQGDLVNQFMAANMEQDLHRKQMNVHHLSAQLQALAHNFNEVVAERDALKAAARDAERGRQAGDAGEARQGEGRRPRRRHNAWRASATSSPTTRSLRYHPPPDRERRQSRAAKARTILRNRGASAHIPHQCDLAGSTVRKHRPDWNEAGKTRESGPAHAARPETLDRNARALYRGQCPRLSWRPRCSDGDYRRTSPASVCRAQPDARARGGRACLRLFLAGCDQGKPQHPGRQDSRRGPRLGGAQRCGAAGVPSAGWKSY